MVLTHGNAQDTHHITIGHRDRTTTSMVSTHLRRNTHSNKYDGFKAPLVDDNKPYKSKVKQRVIPSAPGSSSAPTQNVILISEEAVPPPSPIPAMQDEGINMCAIPEEELSTDAPLAEDSGPSSTSA